MDINRFTNINNFKKYNFNINNQIQKDNEKFITSDIKTNLNQFMNTWLLKMKKLKPDIFKSTLEIYHLIAFYILPNSIEQEIHMDDFYHKFLFDGYKEPLYGIQIFIPLHDTPLKSGPTIMYKKNKIDFNLLLKNGYHSRIGYANKQNFPSHSIHNNKILKKCLKKQ